MDGILAVLWRRAARARHQNTWIVLDGPVDAIWIENLNSVLDDNRVLTLSNGDRIQMTSRMRAIFECENLRHASPATVSRAGIVYLSQADLGWEPILDSWLQQRRAAEASALQPLCKRVIERTLDQARWAGGVGSVVFPALAQVKRDWPLRFSHSNAADWSGPF